jgi:hypothetical protein
VKIERVRPTRFVVELHAYELANLIAAARWAIEADDLPSEAVEDLQRIVAGYDDELTKLRTESRSSE